MKSKFPHPEAKDNLSRNAFDIACEHSMSVLRSCKDSIAENMTLAITAFENVVNALLSVFRTSGKERGPGGSFGDL